MNSLDIVLDELADRLAARILGLGRRETYSSKDLPPRCSRRRFAELCRSGRVVGARREGRDWVCSRESWDATRVRVAAPATRKAPNAIGLSAKADELLARAGLRVVRGAR